MIRLLYVLFFLSGLAGLVYETMWSRYLALFVGHSAYAQVIVLTIFLGGLSVGALVVGQISERIRRPLLIYAGVELAVGVMGLFFHDAFGFLTRGAYPGSGVRWLVAGAMILPQSVLLGTTFPLMSAALLRREPDRPGHTLALLYFVNSLGAASGALVAGFVLVGAVGLPGSLMTAGVLNVIIALVTWGVARVDVTDRVVATAPAPVRLEVDDPRWARRLWHGLLGLAFGTAVASFIYEIAWIRMLSLVLGSATHAFEIMLSAFILGIALGALYIERRADRIDDPVAVLATIQWIMGFAALATLPVYVASFSWTAGLVTLVPATDAGYGVFNLARYGIALAVMLPSTFCAGMVLPLLTRVLVVGGEGERSVGWAYGVNTLGSIVGVALGALVLLPLLGVKLLLIVGAGLDMALGVGLLYLRPARSGREGRLRWLGWGATAVVMVGLGVTTRLDPVLLSAGVFRSGRVPGNGARALFYEDGRTATVSVVESDEWRLISTNGKTDASVRLPRNGSAGEVARGMEDPPERRPLIGDEPTQLLLAVLPLAYHETPGRVANIGQGSGMTSHYLLASPEVGELVTIEIEPEIIEGSREFLPANRRVFEDPRSGFVVDDARSVLQSDPAPWDVIVSEPSNPWVSGVSSLFTDEFYATVHDRLAPGGIFVQWLQVYELSDELVLSVLAALHNHFPSYHVYRSTGDILVVAGTGPTLPEPDWSVLELDALKADLRRMPELEGAHLSSLRVADRDVLSPLLDRWVPVNSDYRPVLDLRAERSRFLEEWASGLLSLGAGPLHVASPYLPPNRALLRGPAPFPEIDRTEGLALNASLRAASRGRSLAELPGGPDLPQRFYELRRFRAAMEGGEEPGEWIRWTREAQRVVEWLHGGLTGVADQGLFDELNAYLDRAGAPRSVYAAVDFLRDSHAWDFRGTARVGRVLLDEVRAGRVWIRPEVLLDGLATACLRVGDVEGAREAWELLRPLSAREATDIRVRLLEAHLEAAAAAEAGGRS